MASITPSLEKRTRRAVLEEALFRPRGAIILAATLILAFIFSSLWWIIAGVGVVVWLISFAETRRNSAIRTKAMAHTIERDMAQPEVEPEFELKSKEIELVLETLTNSIRDKVSPDVLVKVESIKTSILDILPQISNISSSDHNIYTIRQVALDYLPETLENYLKLSSDLATTKPLKEGKTAYELLLEQLNLLDTELKEILEDIHHDDAQRLLAHGRFLGEKFSKGELWLSDDQVGN